MLRTPVHALARASCLALVLTLIGLGATGCASKPIGALQGADDLETARLFLEMGRYEEAAELVSPLVKDSSAGSLERAEAAFLAGEAEMGDGNEAKALQHYRYVLENAPWSKHAGAISDRLFEIGEIFFHDERYDGWFGGRSRGVEAFETFQAYFRNDPRASDALRRVADYFVDDGEYEEAAFTYDRLIETYPESEWVERSLWRAGWCRLQLAQGPQYGREEYLLAQVKFRESLLRYPRGVAAQDVSADLMRVRADLALNELVVADFYRSRGKWDGERLRLANAWILYPETPGGAEAKARLLAANVDLELLKTRPGLNSVDNVKPGKLPWNER